MEPFSILCRSCAARLKVTKASAVGQVLACPKCGTMIEVTPPAGWVAPESATDISVSKMSSGDLGTDFDDIEHILSKPQQPPRPAAKTPRQKPKTQSDGLPKPQSRSPQNRKPRAQSAQAPQQAQSENDRPRRQPVSAPTTQAPLIDGPVLPNDQWTSDESRKRKRIVTAIVGVLGTFLVLGVVGTAIVFNLMKPDPVKQVAADPQFGDDPELAGNNDAMLNDDDLADAGPFAAINNDPEDDPKDDAVVDVGKAPPVVVGGPPRINENPRVNGRAPSIAESTVKEPEKNHSLLQELTAPDIGDIGNDDPDGSKRPEQDPVAPPQLEMKSPFAGTQPNADGALSVEPGTKPDRPAEVGMVEALESDLGDLSALLEASGTSIMEFKDLTAAIRTRQIVGIPKYIMSFPEPAGLDLQKQLELPIGGIKFDNSPLMLITQNLAAITGIPITIDARSIAAVGKPTNPELSIMISDKNLDEALTEMLTPLGFSHIAGPNGLTIGIFPSTAMTPKTFELPGAADIDDIGKKSLVAAIQVLIETESWARTDNPATIKLVGNEIVVNCSADVQTQIQSLLSKLDSSVALGRSLDDATALANTSSRWNSIKPSLSKDPALSHSVQTEIGVFLNKLRLKTGVSTIIDWQHVISERWTPQTIVPGNIREPTLEKTIAELAQAMDLTFTAVDETTLMITTFDQAARMVDLEVYPLSSLVPARLAPQQLNQLVSESLGAQLQSERVKFIYEPNFQCLIVSAPQQIQRQIEALVDRLQSDLIAPDRRPDKSQQAMKPLSN